MQRLIYCGDLYIDGPSLADLKEASLDPLNSMRGLADKIKFPMELASG